jgi:antitoxin ParD1/3/4
MQIILPPELESLIQHQLDSGKYKTAVEVIFAGVNRLEQEEGIYQGRLQALQQEALIGWEAIQRGELFDGAKAMAELRATFKEASPETYETHSQEYLGAVAGIQRGLTERAEGQAVPAIEALEQLRKNQSIALEDEDEDWSDFDVALLDGLEEDYIDSSLMKVQPNSEN